MSAVLLCAACTAGCFLIGRGPLRLLPSLERWLMAASVTLLLLALVSLVAVRLGHYSPWLSSCGVLLACGAAFRLARSAGFPAPAGLAAGGERGVLALLACFAALYGFYPTYFLLGGRDPGIYLLLAARAARTGGLDMSLPWVRAAHAATHGALTPGYPAVYSWFSHGLSRDPNRLSAQFMHLFPALGANAWATGGIEPTVRVNALVAVLALANGFMLCRRIGGGLAAVAFVAALGLNPAFIWGARITLSEVAALWLNFLGLVCLVFAQLAVSRRWAVAGGLILGVGVLNRLDAGFSSFALLGFALAAVQGDRRLLPCVRAASLAHAASATLGFIDGFANSRIYFTDLVERHSLSSLIALSLGMDVVAFGLAICAARWSKAPLLGAQFARRCVHAGALALAVWLAFALFVWPALVRNRNSLAATELGWYVTPFVFPLALAGIALAGKQRSRGLELPAAAFAGSMTFLYTMRTDVTHDHIWASRRWLPHVIPLLLLFAVLALDWMVRRAPTFTRAFRLGAAALAIVYLGASIAFARPFLFRSMLAGLPAAYERFAAAARTRTNAFPFVTGDEQLASILTYVYDVPTMLPNDTGRLALAHGDLAGRMGVGFGPLELGDVTEYTEIFRGPFLEPASTRRPQALIEVPVALTLGRLGGKTFEVEVMANSANFGTIVGERYPDGSVHTTGRAGALLNGPWASMTPGQYEVDWLGSVWAGPSGKTVGALDVIADAGARVLGQMPLRVVAGSTADGWLGGVDFTIDRPTEGVEFRMSVTADVSMVLRRVRLRRVGVPTVEVLKSLGVAALAPIGY